MTERRQAPTSLLGGFVHERNLTRIEHIFLGGVLKPEVEREEGLSHVHLVRDFVSSCITRKVLKERACRNMH